jgi:CheY-like chemotaxis protein
MTDENRPRAPALSSLRFERVSYTTRPRRVLVVDDNLDSVRALAALVADMGHKVEYAINGWAAIDMGQRTPPEIVLLDIGLPGMDGYELCRRMRNNPAFKHSRIIALTAYGKDEDRAKSREAGCEQHLIKPVAAQQLFDLLEQ